MVHDDLSKAIIGRSGLTVVIHVHESPSPPSPQPRAGSCATLDLLLDGGHWELRDVAIEGCPPLVNDPTHYTGRIFRIEPEGTRLKIWGKTENPCEESHEAGGGNGSASAAYAHRFFTGYYGDT